MTALLYHRLSGSLGRVDGGFLEGSVDVWAELQTGWQQPQNSKYVETELWTPTWGWSLPGWPQ